MVIVVYVYIGYPLLLIKNKYRLIVYRIDIIVIKKKINLCDWLDYTFNNTNGYYWHENWDVII